ncbi:MAG: ribonuclease III [Bdellovibrionaceae bacterium]|nr:ribonuclease III [Pseudobdellovibrionaceae bacterium]
MDSSWIQLEQNLGYRFKEQKNLQKALTHKSFLSSEKNFNNEKLEFLGDAVVDLIFSEWLYELFLDEDEGTLSKKRASLVNETVLSDVALELKLDQSLIMGKGEIKTDGAKNPRILASVFEAVVGAMFLESGYEITRSVCRRLFTTRVQSLNSEIPFEKDFKTRIQEIYQKQYKRVPRYQLIEEVGPPHDRIFIVELVFDDVVMSRAQGRSKKEAEQRAAEEALRMMNEKRV